MAVRAKFSVDSFEVHQQSKQKDKSKGWGPENMEIVEVKTIKMSPVYANDDPNHENSKFWDATPSGKLELGTINPEAHKQFELGKEYYVDFTPAE